MLSANDAMSKLPSMTDNHRHRLSNKPSRYLKLRSIHNSRYWSSNNLSRWLKHASTNNNRFNLPNNPSRYLKPKQI